MFYHLQVPTAGLNTMNKPSVLPSPTEDRACAFNSSVVQGRSSPGITEPAAQSGTRAAFPLQLKGLSESCSGITPAGHHHHQPPATAVLGKAIRGSGTAGINTHWPRSRAAVSYLEPTGWGSQEHQGLPCPLLRGPQKPQGPACHLRTLLQSPLPLRTLLIPGVPIQMLTLAVPVTYHWSPRSTCYRDK